MGLVAGVVGAIGLAGFLRRWPGGDYEFRSTVPGQDDMAGTVTVP